MSDELIHAVLAGDRGKLSSLRRGLSSQDPHRQLLQAMGMIDQVRRGQSKAEDAAALVKPILDDPPDDPGLHALLLADTIALETAQGDLEDAGRNCDLLRELLAESADSELHAYCARIAFSQLALAEGDPSKSLDILDEALRLRLDSTKGQLPALLLARAHRCIVLQKSEAAQESLNQANGILPPQAPLRGHLDYLQVMLYCHTRQIQPGLDLLDQLRSRGGINPAWLSTQRIQLLVQARRLDEARIEIESMEAASRSGSVSEMNLLNLRSMVALAQGNTRESGELARRAMESQADAHAGMPLCQRSRWALVLLLEAELAEGRAQAARRVLRMLDPEATDSDTASNWMRLALLERDWASALKHYQRAVAASGKALPPDLEYAYELTVADLMELQRLDMLAKARAGQDASGSEESPPGPEPDLVQDLAAQEAGFLGISPAASRVRQLAGQFADSDMAVLITGESGTGKEVVSRMLHERSGRSQEPFLPVNCGGLSDTIMESELFGHVKGAFTGAQRDRKGLFEAAGKGTILLDEVHSMSSRLQSALLRVLENHEIRPVGGNEVRRIHCRILAASNVRLEDLVEKGSFRQDLYYRLDRLHIHIPPLRERPEDIPILARHFLRPFYREYEVAIGADLMAALQQRDWSGNARQLRNVMERIAILNGDQPVLGSRLLGSSDTVSSPVLAAKPAETASASPCSQKAPQRSSLRNRRRRRSYMKDLFQQRKELTRAEIVEIVGCAPSTATRDLKALMNEGVIERVHTSGHLRTSYFRLCSG